MATVIYLPKGGKGDLGEALGSALAGVTTSKIAEGKQQARSTQLAELFEGLSTGGDAGQQQTKQAISSGAVSQPSDIIRLLALARQQQQGPDLVKVPAFDEKGQPAPFAATLADVRSGKAEKDANARGLTLSGQRKSVAKPTDRQLSISDYLKSKNIQSTSESRSKARQFLFNRNKASDIINSQFGKKFGTDWVIEPGVKQQMAAFAEDQIESLIIDEGLTAQQAGTEAVRRARIEFEDQITEPEAKLEPEGENIFEQIKRALGLTGGDDKAEQAQEQSTEPKNEKELESLGTLNGIDIGIPKDEVMSPAQAAEFISKTYGVSLEDARSFVLGLEP